MDAGEHDVLRSFLIVGTPDELRELTKDKHLVGKWIEALKDDPGLSAVLKEFPYQSPKRGKSDNFNLKGYYPEKVGMSMIFVRPEEEAQASTSMPSASSAGRTLTSMDIKNNEDSEDNEGIDATVIWHLISEGFAGNLRQLHDHFINLSEDKRIKLMAATDADGNPALFMGMQEGHAEAIKAYGELLKQFESIPEDLLVELIAGKSAGGYSALFVGVHEGHAEAVKVYGELLKLLPPDKQTDLLFEKISHGPLKGQSGLQIALKKGHFRAANELLQLLTQLAPELSPEKRAMLQKELKNFEKTFGKPTAANSSSLREWSRLKSSFSTLQAELSK